MVNVLFNRKEINFLYVPQNIINEVRIEARMNTFWNIHHRGNINERRNRVNGLYFYNNSCITIVYRARKKIYARYLLDVYIRTINGLFVKCNISKQMLIFTSIAKRLCPMIIIYLSYLD